MITKKFTTLQLFSVVDGRLSTSFNEFSIVINHIMGREIQRHEVPAALAMIKEVNPFWYRSLKAEIDTIKIIHEDDFEKCIQAIKGHYNFEFEIPQLTQTNI